MENSKSMMILPVAMDGFKVLSLSIAGPESDIDEATPQLHAEFDRAISNDRERAVVKAHMVISEENRAYYSIDIQAKCEFEFQHRTSQDEIDHYLSFVGATRLMDAMRLYLEQATTPFSLGPVSIPAVAPVVEWVEGEVAE